MTTALYLAIILLVGLLGGKIAHKFNLPSVTGYLIFGLLLGPSVLNIITTEVYYSMGLVSDFAIGILAITVGMELHLDAIRKNKNRLFTLSLGNTIFTAVLVCLVTWGLGMPLNKAAILGVLSLTVSPSGVVTIIKEQKSNGPMTSNLLNLVAFDNIICIMIFSLVLSVVQSVSAASFSVTSILITVVFDIVLGILLGAATGIMFAFVARMNSTEDNLLVFYIAAIFLNIGISNILGLQPVLASIFTGAVITNLTTRPTMVVRVFDRIETPVFVLFLTLSGAHIDLGVVVTVGLIGLGYVLTRSFGRVVGVYLAGKFTDLSTKVRKNLGTGLLPQAGIAIGLATAAEQALPNADGTLTGVILTGVVFFEILGPLILRRGLIRAGETNN